MTPFLWRILPLIVLGTALCSLANILLTRNMSAAEYGAFSFFLSAISLMSLIGLLGFSRPCRISCRSTRASASRPSSSAS
jgi:hypothetical protein